MPFCFTPIGEDGIWFGSTWTVDDEDTLAEMIARVAIGQSRAVERILHTTGATLPDFPRDGYVGARRLLTLDADEDPYHRDGWLFQVMSWIAAHGQDDAALIRAPQMIHADKGLDGLMIEFDGGDIARVVICEEKATTNPRERINSDVWPEFESFEAGDRDNELIASVTALLERSGDPDPDAVVADILWRDQRAYRVAVTVGRRHASEAGRKRLFNGYDDVVDGRVARRRAETIRLDELRDWMEVLAAKALHIIEEAEAEGHV